jgi:hypothetical protein
VSVSFSRVEKLREKSWLYLKERFPKGHLPLYGILKGFKVNVPFQLEKVDSVTIGSFGK